MESSECGSRGDSVLIRVVVVIVNQEEEFESGRRVCSQDYGDSFCAF